MKITDVEIVICSVPMAKPIVTPVHRITTFDNVLVTIKTDEGIEGISYLWVTGLGRARVLAAMVADLKGLLLGRDPLERSDFWRRAMNEIGFIGRSGVSVFGLAALDTALWDIAAKSFDVPLYRLLGGKPMALPIYAGGMFLSDSRDEVAAEAAGYIADGFTAVKMRVGTKDWREDVGRVEAVRSAIGREPKLMLDAAQAWSADQAIRMAREVARFDISWLEDPVPHDQHDARARVAATLDIPVVAGELEYGMAGFRRMLDAGSMDVTMIDLQRAGGISEWLRIAHLSEAYGREVVPHVFYEISIHMLAGLSIAGWLEYVPYWDGLFRETPRRVGGTIAPRDAPGLGLTFDRDAIERYRVA